MDISQLPRSLSQLVAGLFGSIVPETESEPEAEHEVYLAGLWDSNTHHALVVCTGTLAKCQEYVWNRESKDSRPRYEERIRPTGRTVGQS